MSENVAGRWLCRYKLFFFLGLLIFVIQVFLAYKSLHLKGLTNNAIPETDGNGLASRALRTAANQNSVGDDEDARLNGDPSKRRATAVPAVATSSASRGGHSPSLGDSRMLLSVQQLGFTPTCNITAKETISALQRAKTKDCRKHIAAIACAIQAGELYARRLPSHCPAGNHTANAQLGCYRDEKEYRLLSGYFANFKTSNTPLRCTEMCLQSGFPYAGLQYGTECFCGSDHPPNSARLADSSCNMKCSGDAHEVCGGHYAMNVYATGIAKFSPRTAETSIKAGARRVKIAFLLTLNGRALRQVHRLLRALYSPNHVFYIHVDARQDYLYRKLLDLELRFRNIRLARKRFSTIWGGASLLTMLLQCMEDLLASEAWQWDYVINLSESDFPVKRVDQLVDFLTANDGRNFVKSHGRETQRFIQKQGLDKTFVECDTHMWRIGDRQLPAGIQIDGGSDWVALSRPFVEYVITQSAHDPLLEGLLKIFRHTLLPAESFFHTVLRNSRFCDSYVDNNLHVTNWKRKLGCKCQYKHVVDWCGCSPNDFKPDDWSRLESTADKMLYFARKFEPIINQAILVQLEEWLFGRYPKDLINLHSYWQSFYHVEDPPGQADDLTRSIAESLVRRLAHQFQLRPKRVLELTHYMHSDQYKGYLLRYEAFEMQSNRTVELETRIRPVQYVKVARNSKFAKRLRNFEVSSEFDQKEQVSRNFARFLGPHTELVLSFTVLSGAAAVQKDAAHSYNLTLLWIDPMGRLQDFNELHIEDVQTDSINFSKALLKQPLSPGVWTAKLIGRSAIYAQIKFLVAPLALHTGSPIALERARLVNAGAGVTLSADFELPDEWQQYLPTAEEREKLAKSAARNALRVGRALHEWLDELVGRFQHIRETCAITPPARQLATEGVEMLPLCTQTSWSSLAPDPKSDVYALLKTSS